MSISFNPNKNISFGTRFDETAKNEVFKRTDSGELTEKNKLDLLNISLFRADQKNEPTISSDYEGHFHILIPKHSKAICVGKALPNRANLDQVCKHIENAEKIMPKDPEKEKLKGYFNAIMTKVFPAKQEEAKHSAFQDAMDTPTK